MYFWGLFAQEWFYIMLILSARTLRIFGSSDGTSQASANVGLRTSWTTSPASCIVLLASQAGFTDVVHHFASFVHSFASFVRKFRHSSNANYAGVSFARTALLQRSHVKRASLQWYIVVEDYRFRDRLLKNRLTLDCSFHCNLQPVSWVK